MAQEIPSNYHQDNSGRWWMVIPGGSSTESGQETPTYIPLHRKADGTFEPDVKTRSALQNALFATWIAGASGNAAGFGAGAGGGAAGGGAGAGAGAGALTAEEAFLAGSAAEAGGGGLGGAAAGGAAAAAPAVSGATGAAPAVAGATPAATGLGGYGGLVGAALGGILGSQSGSQEAGTTTTTQEIPAWLKPYVLGMLPGATAQLNQSVANPSPVLGASQNEMLKTLGGAYYNSNPYLDATFNMGADRIQERLSPTFGHMQAFGSNTGYNQALGRSIGDYATQLYGGNYQQERARQFGATAAGPEYAGAQTSAQFAPYTQYRNLLNFGGGTTTQPYFTNPAGGALGGALAGYSMSRMFS